MIVGLWTQIKASMLSAGVAGDSLFFEEANQQIGKSRSLLGATSIAGKRLLSKILENLSLQTSYDIRDIRLSAVGKPYFPHGPDFSISHTQDTVICMVAEAGRVGVDIEQQTTLALDDYSDYFNENEKMSFRSLKTSADISEKILYLWTRKEAVRKAAGRGIDDRLNAMEVTSSEVRFENGQYQLMSIDVGPTVMAHVAFSSEQPVRLQRFDLAPVIRETE